MTPFPRKLDVAHRQRIVELFQMANVNCVFPFFLFLLLRAVQRLNRERVWKSFMYGCNGE